jgi:hypothetical protein
LSIAPMPLDLDAHPLAGSQKPSGEHADADGRPVGDEVAGLQRADAGQRRDHVGNRGDHLVRGAVLAELAVDSRADTETRWIKLVGRDDPGPNRPMGVKSLARPHRWGVLLPVTYRDVVAHWVAGDGRKRRGGVTPLVDDHFLVFVNAWWEPLTFAVPADVSARRWEIECNTFDPARTGTAGGQVDVGPRSTVVLRSYA